MIDNLRISDKTDSMSDDKSSYQCKSVQFDSPILIESSDCDSDTGIQSFFIAGKRGATSPTKPQSKKKKIDRTDNALHNNQDELGKQILNFYETT